MKNKLDLQMNPLQNFVIVINAVIDGNFVKFLNKKKLILYYLSLK